MANKRQRKKNYNKWAEKMIQQIWDRRPKGLTKRELNQWMDDQIENEGILNWSTQQAVNEAIRDADSGKLQEFETVDEFMTQLESDEENAK
ncbi:hypothetical protein [Secundilactobacillus mixtipabuli]|uniref:Uncharacterized protein n=1 Tax=Secundilactobacillus mixtipabuli TaxID=1435342 RepID=A0A1Z5IA78_9LACO|nr:hypothetical protein [Secundilactobacillus mixtipabuli]GAW98528.1 hypothetical protein IWT30_00473 [Secundilactobacillus mixtipabuli]